MCLCPCRGQEPDRARPQGPQAPPRAKYLARSAWAIRRARQSIKNQPCVKFVLEIDMISKNTKTGVNYFSQRCRCHRLHSNNGLEYKRYLTVVSVARPERGKPSLARPLSAKHGSQSTRIRFLLVRSSQVQPGALVTVEWTHEWPHWNY